eukprot:scaffold17198_cov119-Isochrysis_galbana.AAC.8
METAGRPSLASVTEEPVSVEAVGTTGSAPWPSASPLPRAAARARPGGASTRRSLHVSLRYKIRLKQSRPRSESSETVTSTGVGLAKGATSWNCSTSPGTSRLCRPSADKRRLARAAASRAD